jgi:hypothetical protein
MTGLEGFAVVALLFLAGLFVVFVVLGWAFVRGARMMENSPDHADVLGLSGAADAFTETLPPITASPPGRGDSKP